MFLTRFDKQDEDDQVQDESEVYVILNIIQNLTLSEIDIKVDIRSKNEKLKQSQKLKDSS